ncbi:putative reverse transcriptase domain-containing protein [Tanacetum coccineum]|uniref:Reverse transcriptase domain-containing protein n=1 Tax=Tanacetum coccineum TaxID=301880 RepID=A0ABQ4XUW4_9ASTR
MTKPPPPNHAADLHEDEPVHPEPAPIVPDHAPAQPEAAQDNMNSWFEEDDEEDEIEAEEAKEVEVEIDDDEDDVEVIHPYEEDDPLNKPPPDSDTEPEVVAVATAPAPASHATLQPLPPLHRFSGKNMDALHSKVKTLARQMKDRVDFEEFQDDAESGIREHLPQERQYQEVPHDPSIDPTLLICSDDPYVAADPARVIDDAADHVTRGNTSGAGGFGGKTSGSEGQGGAPPAGECTFTGFMKCNPTTFHRNKGAMELCRRFKKTKSVATLGLEVANEKPWDEMKTLMKEEFCPPEEIQRMEIELWNLRVKDSNIAAYTQRFNELDLLCSEAVSSEKKKIKAYIHGLPENVKGETTSSKPTTLNEAVRMTHTMTKQKLHAKVKRVAEGNKRRWENNQGGNNSNQNNNNNNNNNRGNYRDNTRHHQYNQRRQRNARAMTTAQNEGTNQTGTTPKSNRCGLCHFDRCPPKCTNCGKIGHKTKDCQGKAVASGANAQPVVVCYEYRERDHKSNKFSKRTNQRGGNATG